MKIEYQPIGVIQTPLHDPEDMPIQPAAAEGARATVEVLPAYEEAPKDLDAEKGA